MFTCVLLMLIEPILSFAPFVGAWLSPVEHLVRDEGVGGSNPLTPTSESAEVATMYSEIRGAT